MEEQQFWCLDSGESTTKLADYTDDVDWESIKCSIDDGHQRAGRRLGELDLELPGSTVQDFVWTWLHECVVQDRVLELFRKNNVTGFDVKPVKAKFKRK